jgi:acyl dehydratase
MTPRSFKSFTELASHAGTELGVSEWLTIGQQQITAFAGATDDQQWIHTDPVRAKAESPYQSTIAHGFLTLSLIVPMFASALTIGGAAMNVNYGLNRVRFTAAVLADDQIRGRFTLQEYKAIEAGAQITWNVIVERKNSDKPALIAEWIMRCFT